MDVEPEKILVAGDIDGHFKELYSKVQKVLSSHGKFSFLLVAGNFFGDSEADWLPYKNGSKPVPIDTYILGPSNSEQLKFFPGFKSGTNQLKLSDQVICLGKSGVFITSSGLTVGYLSGTESRESSLCGYSESDALKFMSLIDENRKYKPVDIFITPQWPKDITTECSAKNPSTLLQKVVKSIIPRYIFCATEGLWYKRSPYNNDEPYSQFQSRFIALGRIPTKEKWLFALELSKDNPDAKKPLHCVNPSPFKNVSLVSFFPEEQYRWNLKRSGSNKSDGPKPFKKKHKEDSNCWFCLSSPTVEKHLLISIGKETYIALSKGGLVKDHLLISSITHVKSYNILSDQTKEEINKHKKAISNYFMDKGCCSVFFERNLRTTVHFQIDSVPIPKSKVSRLKDVFKEYALKYELEIEWYSSKHEVKFPNYNENEESEEELQYFLAELPSSEVLFIPIHDKFPIMFARYVLADKKILDKADRVNWRKCNETIDEEKEISNTIRNEFKPYDISRR